MGSYLDKPETSKKSTIEENEFMKIGSSSMQVIILLSFSENQPMLTKLINFSLHRDGELIRR